MRNQLLAFALLCLAQTTTAQTDAGLFRYPDVSDTHIAFVYGGDIWLVSKSGGVAQRLTSSTGEEGFPRFSPDGKMLAFSATYRGNGDAYVMPVSGGMPERLTWHGMNDRVVDWHPDNNRVLIASARESGVGNINQFYLVNKKGGMAEKLPIPYGELGSFSQDGNAMVYVTRITENYPFKRYRGGLTSDLIWFDLKSMKAKNLTNTTAIEAKPVYVKDKIYFLSDNNREQRMNLWELDPATEKSRQLTDFKNMDINHMSAGSSEVVFEAGGQLHLYNVGTGKHTPVNIQVLSDYSTLMPRVENVSQYMQALDLSPDAKRVVVEARGELFSVPAEFGPVINLTNSSGAFDQSPAWSPNGKYVAYWSDKTGEYELWLADMSATGKHRKLTNYGKGMGFRLNWSPDSKKLAFINHEQEIHVVEVADGKDQVIDKTTRNPYPALRGFTTAWSPDSRWLAYNKSMANENEALYLYDLQDKKLVQVTSGYYNDAAPAFDPGGKYLFFLTDRSLNPVYSGLDGTWIYPNSTQVAYLPLELTAKSLLAPRNDEVKIIETDTAAKPAPPAMAAKPAEEKPKPAAPKAVSINTNAMEGRVQVLPLQAGNYGGLMAAEGKLIYMRFPNSGSEGEQPALLMYDLEKREEKRIMANVRGYAASADGKSLAVRQGNNIGIIKPMPDQRVEKPLRISEMEMTLAPKEEWNQIFNDTWRRYRDFFYDPAMQQVNWDAVRKHYGTLMENAITRWDVTNITQEMIAETSAGHTYARNGGDIERASNRGSGFLGVDYKMENGGYRIERIIKPAPWDNEVRSPLEHAPGVKEGDYIVAVNGQPLHAELDPAAALDGRIGSTVLLRVNSKPGLDGSKEVVVNTLTTQQERRLRHLAWIENNRKKVDELSGGRLGYMYMPNTGQDGQTELMRQFYAQIEKDGFVIDERFNAGGQLGDRFIEMLNRPNLYNIAWRNAGITRVPTKGNAGPKVMLINGWAGSGGDAFPWAFKTMNMGPIIGERTLGILVGPATGHQLIDGGSITVPDARLYGPDGKWFWEGVGVSPTIPVWDDPAELARGNDPQLKRAVEEAMKLVKAAPQRLAPRPPYEDRTYQGLEKKGN